MEEYTPLYEEGPTFNLIKISDSYDTILYYTMILYLKWNEKE